jgi:hypothetical protein
MKDPILKQKLKYQNIWIVAFAGAALKKTAVWEKSRCRWLRREILRRKRCSINIWKGREHGWKCRREVILIGAFLTSINLNNLSLRFIVRNT